MIVTSAYGTVTSAAAVLTVGVPPSITTQPANRSVVAGNPATFTVVATGTGSLTYQWRKGNSGLAGETSATLTIANCQAANAGSYTVIVTNAYGTVTSAAAVLTVGVPPTITTQPINAAVVAGKSATFTAAATGTGSLTYQWFKDDSVLAGKTSATLSLSNCQAANAGSYRVIVTSAYGTVTSAAAVL